MRRSLAAFAISTAVAGCGGPQGGSGSELGKTSKDLWALSSAIWRSPTIPVCWENPTPGNVYGRGIVQDTIQRTWEAVSRVDFVGWGACTPGAVGIHIEIVDGPAQVFGLGMQLDGLTSGMQLNFSYLNWGRAACTVRNPIPGGTPLPRESCIRVDAIHEFGHALGFPHEQARADDTPATCTYRDAWEVQGDYDLDAWDIHSIMNYCNPRYLNRTWPYVLSSSDVRGVQQLYGGRPGMLVGHSGRCLDVAGSPFVDGTTLQTADCQHRPEQRWRVLFGSATAPLGTLRNILSGKAIDLPGNLATPGALVRLGPVQPQTAAAAAPTSQTWNMYGPLSVRGHGGRCMDVVETNGQAHVLLTSCPPGQPSRSAQRWTRNNRGHFISSNGKCLEVPSGAIPNGTPVRLGDCIDRTFQFWDLETPGRIRVRSNGKCLDALAFGTDSTPLVVWDCGSATNQHFMLRGRIAHGATTASNVCLAVRGGVNQPGTPVELAACTGNDNQLWDYHP